MFGPLWGPPPPFDLPTYLAGRSKGRRSLPEPHPHPPIWRPSMRPSLPLPPGPYGMRGPKPSYPNLPKLPKHTRFSPLSTRSSSDFSSSELDDTYTLDTDSDFSTSLPRLPSLRRRHPRSSPDFDQVSVKVPSPMASELRSDQVLILPALVHLRIRIHSPHSAREDLRAAVPATMSLGDVTKQVVQSYFGEGVGYTARVDQRGRMHEAPRDATLEELAHRGEVHRDGRMEMKVEIVVGDEGDWVGSRARFGGRGPRGGAEVETVRKREVSRTRVAHG